MFLFIYLDNKMKRGKELVFSLLHSKTSSFLPHFPYRTESYSTYFINSLVLQSAMHVKYFDSWNTNYERDANIYQSLTHF